MSVVATTEERTAPSRVVRRTTPAAALASLGIVYGDLGTSPLYTLQAITQTIGGRFTFEAAIGVLSLILCALVITISVKYFRDARGQPWRGRDPGVDAARRRNRV